MAENDFNAYEQKQAERRERFEDLADKARRESSAAFEQSRKMADVIPLGQPILIGHHSEGRDRRYRARIAAKMDKSCELASKANYYQQKAASVGNGGISSDDPQAVTKLREELAKLERLQDTMKKANACIRKNDRAGLAALGFDESRIDKLFLPDFAGRIGFPDYALTNNSANMRRIRQRIESLAHRPATSTEKQEGDVTIREDVTENRVMLIFPGKPSEAVREILKASAFKWSPTRGAWVRFLNNAGRMAAQYVLEQIKGKA
jgi:hypothetical protein